MTLALVPNSNRGRHAGKAAKRFDCGEHGKLTAREIAKRAGLANTSSVYERVGRGLAGEELLRRPVNTGNHHPGRKPIWRDDGLRVGTGATGALTIGLIILRDYPTQPPSMEALRARFGMSRATAYRWRNAWLAVLGDGEK